MKRPYVSASQISKFSSCPRKWAYSRIHREPPTKATEFGTLAHKHAEDWLTLGTPPPQTPEGKCIIGGLEYLPLPKTPGLKVEHKFSMSLDEQGGISDTGIVDYIGQIDFIYGYDPGRIIVIGDHKTTSDLRWVKTEDELSNDPQRIVYAYWAVVAYDVDYVAAHWNYYPKRGGAAKPVIVVEHRATIETKFKTQHINITLPLVSSLGLPPERIDRNLSHCNAFGGCPYKKACLVDMSPVEVVALRFKDLK